MNEISPPPNRALGWYRFIVWVMPTCVALTTALGCIWLTSQLRWKGDLLVLGWFVVNTLAIVGLAIFDAKLRNRPDNPVSLKTDAVMIRFFLLQLLIIPSLSFALCFAACLAGVL
jgi:hypothetical protein